MTTKQAQKQEQLTPAELIKKHGGTKSAAIRALLKDGHTRGEVSKMLGIRYQHVRNVDITPVKNPKTQG